MVVDDTIRIRFRYNGHILGAAFIEIETEGKRIVFSGDVGRPDDPLLYPPQKPDAADILLIESTYGDRLHQKEDTQAILAKIVQETVNREGTVIIPSFAVERAQLLLYLLWKLHKKDAIPTVPIILDSPMGADVLALFQTT